MMYRILSLAPFLFSFLFAFGQTQEFSDQANRAVANRVEFFINSQLTDSIYNLASPEFKTQIGRDQFHSFMGQIYTLGRITDLNVDSIKENQVDYKVDFLDNTLIMVLGVDTNYQFHTFAFRPYVQRHVEPEEPEAPEVLTEVETVHPLKRFIDSLARTYTRQEHAQTLSVGLIHENQFHRYFYGKTQGGEGGAPNEHTVYELGSLTKVFTATLLADLVQKGEVQLDDPIVKYLPDSVASNPSIQKITFESLANHTSGLPRLPDNWEELDGYDKADPYKNYTRSDLFSFLKDVASLDEPGEKYEYSNLGLGLLGELVADIHGMPYEVALKTSILDTLQLHNTGQLQSFTADQLINVYNSSGKAVPRWTFSALAGAGGLNADLNDMLLFARAQLVMPESGLEQAMALTREFTYFTPPMTDIGLAWHMEMMGDAVAFFHTGATAGSSAFIALIPDYKAAVVVLANSALPVDETGLNIVKHLLREQ